MNIKEIIDAERWQAGDHGLAPMPSVEHNAALDRIEAAVVEEMDWFEQESSALVNKFIADLEAELREEARLNGMGADREAKLLARVAELEAALKLAMDWLEDEVPKHIVDKLINTLR